MSVVLDAAFTVLSQEYPIEYVYKSCVLKKMLDGAFGPGKTSLYMEFPVSEARADLLLVNGDATVFEVKTRFDSPCRLAGQLEEYYQCFKKVTVIVERSQAERYSKTVPDHVGVSTLNPGFSITPNRSPQKKSDRLSHLQMFRRMRKKERHQAVSDLGVNLSELHPKDHWNAEFEGFSTLPIETAYNRFVGALRDRQPTDQLIQLCRRLPEYLYASVFSYRITKRDWESLIRLLPQPPSAEEKMEWEFDYLSALL